MNTLRKTHVISPSGRVRRLLGSAATTRKHALSPGQRPRSGRSRLRLVAAVALAATAALPASASDGADDPPPAVPTGLATAVSHDLVTLSWDDPGDDTISGYVILRRDKAVHPRGTFVTLAPHTHSTATTYIDASIDPERRYVYRVKAISPAGTSDRSTWVRAYTPAAPPKPSPSLPAKPRGLATEPSHDTVALSWNDPADGTVTGYVILRRDKDVHPRGTFQTINPDTGTAATSYLDATAEPERRYVYRIKAVNSHGYSTISRWARGYTPAAPRAVFIDGDNQNDQDQQDGTGGHDQDQQDGTGGHDQDQQDGTDQHDQDQQDGTDQHDQDQQDGPDGKDDPAGAPGNGTPPGPGTRANVSEGGTDLPTSTATTGQVDVGGTVTGTIGSAGDNDWFRVELEAGTRYQIDLEGSDTGRGTVSDPVINGVRDAEGNAITGTLNDDSGVGINARTVFTPTASGTHYIDMRAVEASDTGTYTLSVIVLGANGVSEAHLDFPTTAATTGRVEVGGSATGYIDRDTDHDMFKVTLRAGRLYRIDVEGVPTGRGSQPDPNLALFDNANSRLLGADDDCGIGLNGRLVFTPAADGTYLLLVGTDIFVASDISGTGTYTLSVREVTADSGDDPDASGDGDCELSDGDSGPGPAERPEELADRYTEAVISLDAVSRYDSAVEDPVFQHEPLYDSEFEQIGVTQIDPVLTTTVQGRYEGEIDFPGDVDWVRFDAVANAVYEIRVFRPQTAARGALRPRFTTRPYQGQTDLLPAVSHLWFDQDARSHLIAPGWSTDYTGHLLDEDRFVYSPALDSRSITDTVPVFVSVQGGDGYTLVCPSPRPCDNPSVPRYNTHTQVGEYVVTVRELDRSDMHSDAGCRHFLDMGVLLPAGATLDVSGDLSAQQRGRINRPADIDCHQLDITASQFFNKTVRLRLLGSSLGHGTLPDPVIVGVYHNGALDVLDDDGDGGYFRDSEVTFTLQNEMEQYQILVSGRCPSTDPGDEALFNICRRNVGTYRLVAELVD